MAKTKIEWAEQSLNPYPGCKKVSEGCLNCYAEKMAMRLRGMGLPQYQAVVDENGWTGEIGYNEKWMRNAALHISPPTVYFCQSMGDLFYEKVEFRFIDKVYQAMRNAPQHTFQILTKRAKRMAEYFENHGCPDNVWLGVSCENQKRADERIPYLLKTPAKVRFLSLEPLLAPINICAVPDDKVRPAEFSARCSPLGDIDWVIVGGESGPGARPMHIDWVRSIRDQCVAAGVPFFFKQWGGVNKKKAGRILDGRTWDEYPICKGESL